LDLWYLSLRSALDFPTQLFFTRRYAEQFSSHDKSVILLSVVPEIIDEAVNQVAGIVCNMSFFWNTKNDAFPEEYEG